MSFADELPLLLDTADFAETLTFGATSVDGIWSEDYVEEMGVQGDSPQFLVLKTVADTIAIDTTTVRGGTTYKYVLAKDDGLGLVVMILEEQ